LSEVWLLNFLRFDDYISLYIYIYGYLLIWSYMAKSPWWLWYRIPLTRHPSTVSISSAPWGFPDSTPVDKSLGAQKADDKCEKTMG
jgi:hypothetical protein